MSRSLVSTRAVLPAIWIAAALVFLACSEDDSKSTEPPPADTTPPALLSFDPAQGASGVSLLQSFTLVFSEGLDPASVGAESVTLGDPIVPTRRVLSVSGRMLTVWPDSLLPADRSLTLHVAGVTDSAGNAAAPFDLIVTTGPYDCDHLADRFEPNEDSSAATVLEPDTLYLGLATCLGDVDTYRFTLESAARVTVRTPIAYANDESWMIYWSRGNGHDYYATLGTSANTGETESFSYTFLPGTYEVDIWGYDEEPLVLYDLILETSEPCPDDEYEDNDFEDMATPISLGEHTGLRGCYLDTDWYAVPVVAGQSLIFRIDPGEVYKGTRRIYLLEPGGQRSSVTAHDEQVTSDTLAVTADGTAKVGCLYWLGEGLDYDMTIEAAD
ncbi:MAG: Ig-like domain-containing protein [Candidatus Eisenbacteria bacterium]